MGVWTLWRTLNPKPHTGVLRNFCGVGCGVALIRFIEFREYRNPQIQGPYDYHTIVLGFLLHGPGLPNSLVVYFAFAFNPESLSSENLTFERKHEIAMSGIPHSSRYSFLVRCALPAAMCRPESLSRGSSFSEPTRKPGHMMCRTLAFTSIQQARP